MQVTKKENGKQVKRRAKQIRFWQSVAHNLGRIRILVLYGKEDAFSKAAGIGSIPALDPSCVLTITSERQGEITALLLDFSKSVKAAGRGPGGLNGFRQSDPMSY